jgi:hypothetical protein
MSNKVCSRALYLKHGGIPDDLVVASIEALQQQVSKEFKMPLYFNPISKADGTSVGASYLFCQNSEVIRAILRGDEPAKTQSKTQSKTQVKRVSTSWADQSDDEEEEKVKVLTIPPCQVKDKEMKIIPCSCEFSDRGYNYSTLVCFSVPKGVTVEDIEEHFKIFVSDTKKKDKNGKFYPRPFITNKGVVYVNFDPNSLDGYCAGIMYMKTAIKGNFMFFRHPRQQD